MTVRCIKFSPTSGIMPTLLCPNGENSDFNADAASPLIRECYLNSENLCSHGTHVAGIAAGLNPTSGVPPSGVAKNGKILAIQVFTRQGNDVYTWDSDYIAGLDWIYSHVVQDDLPDHTKVAAVNMSLGGGMYRTACDYEPATSIIVSLRERGVATVISSGNDGYTNAISSPSCISAAISVGATTITDRVAEYSNESRTLVDLLAPGSNIDSSTPTDIYESFSGTSMSSPHVAGAFAAIRSRLPDATVSDIETALKATGVPISETAGSFTTPRIQVDQALQSLTREYTLTVARVGDGQISSSPIGIQCGNVCSYGFTTGSRVTLTAQPTTGWRFDSWSGACQGSQTTCEVTLISPNQEVFARFTQVYSVNTSLTGSGSVASTPQ